MSTKFDDASMQVLLAAAIVASGGEIVVSLDDVYGLKQNKYIALDNNGDNTLTMRLVEYSDYNK